MQRKELILKLEESEANNCGLLGLLFIAFLWIFILVMQLAIMGDNFILIAIGAFFSPMILCLPFELKRREQIRKYFSGF